MTHKQVVVLISSVGAIIVVALALAWGALTGLPVTVDVAPEGSGIRGSVEITPDGIGADAGIRLRLGTDDVDCNGECPE